MAASRASASAFDSRSHADLRCAMAGSVWSSAKLVTVTATSARNLTAVTIAGPQRKLRRPANDWRYAAGTMFIGHYGVSFAIKRASPTTSLGTLFLAVQLLDVLF